MVKLTNRLRQLRRKLRRKLDQDQAFTPINLGFRDVDLYEYGADPSDPPKRGYKPRPWKQRRLKFPYTHFFVHEAAQILGVSASSVYKYCRSGKLEFIRMHSYFAIEPESLAEFRQQERYPGRPPDSDSKRN